MKSVVHGFKSRADHLLELFQDKQMFSFFFVSALIACHSMLKDDVRAVRPFFSTKQIPSPVHQKSILTIGVLPLPVGLNKQHGSAMSWQRFTATGIIHGSFF